METFDPTELPELLKLYYRRLFPYSQYYRWLNYGGVIKNYFQHREFSFTLKDDIYIRYQSFNSQSDLEKEMQKMNPYKIDIGAVYSHRDFGFKHRLWVYSGRRGVHCWVCDESVRKLSSAVRSGIVEYLSLVKGGQDVKKKVHLSEKIHPFIRKSINIINKYFEEYALVNQDILENKESWDKILALVPETIHDELQQNFQKSHSSLQRWEHLKKAASKCQNNIKNDKCGPWLEWEIMLQYCFPRLDINVSKGINHLLKSPFSVHPKTGRISVPIDLHKLDEFDPFTVPTISFICHELDAISTNEDKKEENEAESDIKHRTRDYKKTSLAPYVKVFEYFLENLDKSRKGELLKKS
uniref:DNA primase n=1 Tax=Cebus imitator TaxID=2715852 RepID=A0A2K5PHS1_CEBIM